MTSNIINQTPFLRTSRLFPEDIGQLVVELNRAYIDISNSVNNRTIGLFPINRAAAGGENWYVNNNQRQQNIRQVYTITDGVSPINIPHGIDLNSLTNFVRLWGMFKITASSTWNTLPYISVVDVTSQISLSIDSLNIIITKGATAPAISNGLVIAEWISNV